MQSPSSEASRAPDRAPVLVDLALQGGGSHGAFTWGVLDRLLEEPWLRMDGFFGTSAGAMNAAALAYGYALRGNDRARVVLERFWRRVAEAGRLSVLRRGPLDIVFGRRTLDNSPIYLAKALHHRYQRRHRPASRFSEPRSHPGGAYCIRVLAHHVSGDRDRRRGLST